jgi:hypothetical protein
MNIYKLLIRVNVVLVLVILLLSCKHSSNKNSIITIAKRTESIINQNDSTYTKEYYEGFNQGVQEAQYEIEQSAMTFYVYGEEPDYPYSVETGLPVKIIAGCMIDDSITGLVQGHNQTIKNHLLPLVKADEIYRVTSHLDSTFSIEYREAYYQGMQEAYNEIKNNKLTRYVYGKGNWTDIDPETGVVIKVIAGCVVSDSIVGRADGHNYIILKYLKHEIK